MTAATVKIGIAAFEGFMAWTMAIARGQLTPSPSGPNVWFQSTDSFAKVWSSGNRA